MAGHRVLADGSRKPTRSQRQLACWTERIGRAETSDDLLATSYRYVLAVDYFMFAFAGVAVHCLGQFVKRLVLAAGK